MPLLLLLHLCLFLFPHFSSPGRSSDMSKGFFDHGPAPGGGLWIYDYLSDMNAANLRGEAETLTALQLVGYSEPELHSLGIAYHAPSSTLFVVNHSKKGHRIDLFDLDLAAKKATYKKHFAHPLLHAPNAIAIINEHELYVTNDHQFPVGTYGVLAKVEEYAGFPGGSVVHVNLLSGEVKEVARVPFANGIELLNSTTVTVASTTKPAVYFYEMNPDTRDLTSKGQLAVPFMVDNLSVDQHGILFLAGHPHAPSLRTFARSRADCWADETSDACRSPNAASWVAKWTESSGREDLYVDTEYPSSCTAVRDAQKGIGIVAGIYARGILIWKD